MKLTAAERKHIAKGIASYGHEQQVILRLLRRYGSFTERDFDRWFNGREYRRRTRLSGRGITGDSFLLGWGINGFNQWAEYLDLMQWMIRLGKLDAKKENGMIVYKPMAVTPAERRAYRK